MEELIYMELLERIKQLRDGRGYRNYWLAKETNISKWSLNNLFRLNNQPTIQTLEAMCMGFGRTSSQLFAKSDEAVVLNAEQKEILDGLYFIQVYNTS